MSGTTSIKLPEVLKISNLHDTYQDLLQLLKEDNDNQIVFDASEVKQIDTATVQMIIAFQQALKKKNKSLDWQTPSEYVCQMAELISVMESINLTAEATN